MAAEILFLAHRVPFPPDRGDKIRSHHILKALAQLAPVHVGCLAEGEDDLAQEEALAAVAATHWMPPRARPLPLAGMSAVLTGRPVSLAAFADASLRQWVERTLADRPIACIYVYSGQMGQYVPQDWGGRLVVDLVDVDSAKFEAYAEKLGPLRGSIHAREGRLLRRVEQALAARARHTLLVSEEEAALMRARAGAAGDIRALRNGIDCDAFDPKAVIPEARLAKAPGPHLVFTGQMDYPPNIAAVRRFARDIFPAIRQLHPAAQFHIVGRAPTGAVRQLGTVSGVTVWGAVPDVRPFLAAAQLVVAPLTIARGVQNKVLEAMAMARPVLVSPEAATGISAVPGEHLLVCESNRAFIEQSLEIIAFPERGRLLGRNARRYVCERMSWAAMLAPLARLVGIAAPAPSPEPVPEPLAGARDAA